MKFTQSFLVIALFAGALHAADAPPSATKVFDGQLSSVEKEFVSLVEAMPADKFDFAPTQGTFKGVRTFGQQAKHASSVVFQISSAILGEKNPSNDKDESGPEDVKTKEQIVKYAKDAFAYAHRAMAKLNNSNLMELAQDPFNPKAKSPIVGSASIIFWHTFDHYGQMVEYARMNNVIPPASR